MYLHCLQIWFFGCLHFFSYTATIKKKKSVCIIFEGNNKYNNFIKRLTKALALISLQITNHTENSDITAAKQQSTSESHFPLTSNKHKVFYINLSENISYGLVRH